MVKTETSILCHEHWKYKICILILQGVIFERLPWYSEETLDFGLLNSLDTERLWRFSNLTKHILHYGNGHETLEVKEWNVVV